MTANLSFFDIAAGLIPVLLLGGAVADRVRNAAPADPRALPDSAGRLLAPGLAALFAIFAGFAEVQAIHGALTDEYSTFRAWVVALAVVIGTWGLAGAVVWPWVEVFFRPRVPPGQVLPKAFTRSRNFLIGSILVVVVMSGYLLRTAIQVEATNPLPAATTQAVIQNLDADDELIDAKVAAGRMPKSLAKRLRLINTRTRASVTERHLRREFEGAADAFD